MGIGAIGDTGGSSAYAPLGPRGPEEGKSAREAKGTERGADSVTIRAAAAGAKGGVRALAEASRKNEVRQEIIDQARERIANGHADDPAVIAETARRMLSGLDSPPE